MVAIQPKDERLILVTGATGRQGGAVARQLMRRGFPIRALVRDPNKPAATDLLKRGAELVEGHFDDRDSLRRAIGGAYGVFSVQNFWETGYEEEIRQGVNVAEVASEMDVKHFVYSSVGSAHRQTGLPHFDSKWQVEERVRELGLPYSILRPVFFMDNWQTYARDQILSGTLAQPLDPGKPLQQIAVEDIGGFAAMAFEDQERWLSREVDLAGDELTMPQTAEVFSRVMGRPVRYVQVPWDQFEKAAGEETTRMYRWFNEVGYEADIPALRREHPELKTLEEYLHGQEWVRAAAPAAGESGR